MRVMQNILFLIYYQSSLLWILFLMIGLSSVGIELIASKYHLSFFINKDMFTFAGVMIAAAGLFYNADVNKKENSKKESKFYLEKYIEISGMILDCLKSDKPTRRMAWITAANFADQLEKFQKRVTNQSDLDFLYIRQRNYVHLVLDFLSNKPAYYFYGSDDAKTLEEAAENCRENYGKAVHGLVPGIKTFDVDELQIKSILQSLNLVWKEEVGYSMFNAQGDINMNVLKVNNGLFPGLYLYIEDKRSREFIFDRDKHRYIFKKRVI
jgi:hypothetical protein